MNFPQSILHSVLALYGFGEKANRPRDRRGPIEIGRPSVSRLA